MRPTTPAGERVLAAASELFYTRGIHAVGVDLIAETAGTTKKTLYDRFGSKDALIAAYLDRRFERWRTFVEDHLAALPEPGPLDLFDALAAWLAMQGHGCAFVNANAELTAADHPARAVIRQEKQWIRERYIRLAEESGLADPTALGAALRLLHEGAIVASTAGAEPEAVAQARAAAAVLVEAAGRLR